MLEKKQLLERLKKTYNKLDSIITTTKDENIITQNENQNNNNNEINNETDISTEKETILTPVLKSKPVKKGRPSKKKKIFK